MGRRSRKSAIDYLTTTVLDLAEETEQQLKGKSFDDLWDEMTTKTGERVGKNYHKETKFEYLNNKIIQKKISRKV